MIIKGKPYITGMGRNPGEDRLATHLYQGTYGDPGLPMCIYGWNRSDGERYSIFRNNISQKGICKTCLKRAEAGLPGIESANRKTKWI